MSADGFVLVHGGFHDARCWERLVPLLSRPAVAVDLPGRGSRPAPMETVTLEACVQAVLADLDASGFERAVLVGHSLGGATVPVAAARRPERIAHLVLLSTLLAPDGGAIVDGFLPETREQAIRRLGNAEDARIEMSDAHHREMLNGTMSEEDVEFLVRRHVAESRRLFTDRASRAGLPDDLARSYIRLGQDLSVSPAQQAHAISLLPGLEVREIDAPHPAMVTHPKDVAAILNEIAAR
ncbi:MAG: alpha/beta fold hydrolase [Myxococcales bacterium]|nr:alpha/beta fold hydrolase [Myxococcales bacterium]